VLIALVVGGGLGGLLIGSFINVVAYRIPRGISVIKPPSACPACGREIRSRDNLPVIGWPILRGRCRDCSAPISVRYPIVELATGAAFAAAAALLGPVWVLLAFWWFAGVTIALILTDLDFKRIPNRILYPGTIGATVLLAGGAAIEGDLAGLGRALLGGLLYFSLLLIIALLARGGFGFGDVKLALLLGEFSAYRAWESLFVGVFAAFVIGGLLSIGLLAVRAVGRKDAIPFGPAMVLGCYAGIAVGEPIARWYLG
jgi:leader peptidase (prepilin peptidase)/N-methyltransferase